MSLLGKASAILGINARNLLYIAKHNSKASRKLADDKIYTKRFLQARGVGVAKLFDSIKSINELRNFNPKNLPKSFVIKPNKGYGGEGIIVIKKHLGEKFYGPNEKYLWPDLYEHFISILDGRYAISGLRDKVIIEELLEPHEYFKNIIENGLPDIRIIVFKYIPVIAMLRLPTAESNGRANLHLGAIGCGIDIGTGRATFGVRHNKLIKRLPNDDLIRNIRIPNWDEILLTASKTQAATQIGYLAVDLALAKNGIKILELNARAGLAIQISNQSLLRKRLDKIADLKVLSTSEGVRIGKTLFTRIVKDARPTKTFSTKPTIGLFENISIINASNGNNIVAKIDPHAETNIVDKKIKIPAGNKLLSLIIKNIKIKTPFTVSDLGDKPYQIILSGKFLTDFLIDLTKKTQEQSEKITSQTKEEKIIINIDKKITELNEQIHLVARLKPQNLAEAQKTFLKNPKYSPTFTYKKHDINIPHFKNELKKLPRLVDHPLMPLYLDKMKEVENKLLLIEQVGKPAMFEYSKKIFGSASEQYYNNAISFLTNNPLIKDNSKKLSLDEVIKRINTYLREKNLTRWKIKILDYATSGMQINKNNTIFIQKNAKITANRLSALIGHEIETHIYRLENGRLQKYKIFEQGTAGYLLTEEGLAIYNQNRLNLPLGEKFFSPALNVVAIYHGKKMPFIDLFHYLKENYKIDQYRAWRLCLRVKRGLENTDEPGAFTKDLVYFVGYNMIKRLIRDKGLDEFKKLYVGKIGVQDLKYVTDLKQWPIKYFPEVK